MGLQAACTQSPNHVLRGHAGKGWQKKRPHAPNDKRTGPGHDHEKSNKEMTMPTAITFIVVRTALDSTS